MSTSDRTHESEHASPRDQMTTGESPAPASTRLPRFVPLSVPTRLARSPLDSRLAFEHNADHVRSCG
jgi:hypothetical protein